VKPLQLSLDEEAICQLCRIEACFPHWTSIRVPSVPPNGITRITPQLDVASDMGSNHPVHAQLMRMSQVLSFPPNREMLQLLGNTTQADAAL
jgi:hypothetical protein